MFVGVSRDRQGISSIWGASKWIAWWKDLPEGTGGRRKLCMVPCNSCHIYGTWRSKRVGEGFKVITLGVGNFYGGVEPSRHHETN